MSIKSNLNISPYYDDFDKDKNFYRVLFKPGKPVQARELSTLQSILQNQVESFGGHIFKEGSMVIPGGVYYDNSYFSIKIDSEHLGIPVTTYASSLKGKKLKGQNTGIEFLVNDFKVPSAIDGITDLTLFVKYLTSDNNNQTKSLEDSELILAQESITYGNTTIEIGESVANLVGSNACSIGSAVKINAGVYYIRGTFVDVSADTLILDPYSNDPSYRVGLNILESFVTSNDDNSLYDNARGFSNFAAPGADRLKISTKLSKKSLTDTNDTNFVEIIKLREGELKKLQDFSVYSEINKYFAARTYEESGNYSIDNFNVKVSDSLDNGLSNQGIFGPNQVTDEGATPSDDLACIEIEPGKAYVKGYRINSVGTTVIDVPKPRDKEEVESALVDYDMGNILRVNNVWGTPYIGFDDDDNQVDLVNIRRDGSTPVTQLPSGGETIGKARVYSFNLRNTPYSDGASEWNLYLFDVQTYTKLTLNSELSSSQCPASSYIRGISSGATGYVVANASGSTITISQTSGTFISGEKILINESEILSRVINSIVAYGINDVKSVYQDAATLPTSIDFAADTVLVPSLIPNIGSDAVGIVTSTNGLTGSITSPGNAFSGVKKGSIIAYQIANSVGQGYDITFNEVTNVSNDLRTLSIKNVPSVPGVCNGAVYQQSSGITTAVNIKVAKPQFVDNENAGLYIKLPESNISDAILTNSTLTISKQISQTPSSNGAILNIPSGISSAFFSGYDDKKYSVSYTDPAGSTEPLNSDKVSIISGGTQVQFKNLTQNTAAFFNTTIEIQGFKEKIKEYSRSNKLFVTKTSSGVSTSTTGLTESIYYGLRVEDTEISLNVPDVVKVLAVLESKNTDNPTLDTLTFVSGLSLSTNSVVGELIRGSESGAIAQIVDRESNNTDVTIVYLTPDKFIIGELVTFDESNISTILQAVTHGNHLDITEYYTLDKGQKEQFYDYSRIVRKPNFSSPDKKLLIIFDNYIVSSSDTGKVFTVNSYNKERFANDIPVLKKGRASDTLDFRPRVSKFTSSNKSPFAYTSRSFQGSGQTSDIVVRPEGESRLGYNFYLPRIDKLVLNTGEDFTGKFSLIKGVSSVNPKEPSFIDDAMHIATIDLPAYLYDTNDATISLVDNKRYTMRDIGKLDDRISNLETVTSLSLLELDTKSLQIKDATGDRFKSGFFVDDFKDTLRMDIDNPDNKVNIDTVKNELIVPFDRFTNAPEIGISESYNKSTVDFDDDLILLDPNVQKTGDLITLKYTEVESDIGNKKASRVENVNPYEVVVFRSRIQCHPSSDNYSTTEEIRADDIVLDGDEVSETTSRILTGTRDLPFARSRNVGFKGIAMVPLTRYYAFLDGRQNLDVIPKLIEVNMNSGFFTTGEIVEGYVGTEKLITFRLAQPNHRKGTYNSPTTFYDKNPYTPTVGISSVYTESNTILNVDMASLNNVAMSDYYGRIVKGMELKGLGNNASATISDVRLVSDVSGNIEGSFFIRNAYTTPPPALTFSNGLKTLRLTSSDTNSEPLPGSEDTSAGITRGDAEYTTSAKIDTFTSTTTIIRPEPRPARQEHGDPLAQSFTVDETGMFLTSLDLFFATKDESIPLTVQIRTMELGTPTNQILQEYAEVQLDPTESGLIQVSDDASLATKVTFPSPVYLEPGTEYAIVLLAPQTTAYTVWISRMNETTIETKSLGQESQEQVSKQYLGGSLFKSQNGTIWTSTQTEDLKFNLYKASFTNTGALTLYNSSLTSNGIPQFKLQSNSITSYPRKLKVGINNTTVMDSVLVSGVKVTATSGSNVPDDPTGIIEDVGGPLSLDATGITTISSGTGYPASQSYMNVGLFSITGSGSGAKATVTVGSDGSISDITISNQPGDVGTGYKVGDVLGITTADLGSDDFGGGYKVTVGITTGIDTLYLTNVQGQSFTTGKKLIYYTSDTTLSTGAASTQITSSVQNGDLYSGNVIGVHQYNHSMKADNNKVVISGIEPNGMGVTVTTNVTSNDLVVSVANTSPFGTFEGISTSTGYIKIDNEILYYDGIGSGTLSIGSRGFGGTIPEEHSPNSIVQKYEFNGISLTGINTTHDMPTNSTLKSLKNLDSYYIEVNRGSGRTNLQDRSTGVDQVSFASTLVAGGNSLFSTKNFQYDAFVPSFNILTPGSGTQIESQLRSVSGTSEGGSEPSFVDQGYENVEFNQINDLSTPRLICSEIDEVTRLTSLPSNKSVTLLSTFKTTDPNLSPVLDTMNGSFKFLRNRLNSPISNYATDSRSNQLQGDPHAACYISQKVNLKNPSSSLKVLVSAVRPATSDFRVLYRLFKPDSSEIEQSYKLFPGYDNLQDKDVEKLVINPNLNNGKPDEFVPASNEFLDYEFTIDNEDEFIGFQIKIVMSGTNESQPPRFKDLRAIALA